MPHTLLCEIVTPERIVYTSEVELVVVPSELGEMGILPLHEPIVAVLEAGEVRVRHAEHDWDWFAISGGYVQVHEDKVIVLAQDAASVSTIDLERVKESIELTKARMNELCEVDREHPEISTCEADLVWAETQVRIATRR